MKTVFRLKYQTHPGQSLWLKLAAVLRGGEIRLEQELPMHWHNERQWQLELDYAASVPETLEYSYQLRDESNGMVLDEWGGPRRVADIPASRTAMLLEDAWSSAGTIDCAYETKAFASGAGSGASFKKPRVPIGANHAFHLRMAGVAKGLVPCLLGSTREIGDWGWHHALPMDPVGENLWCVHVHLPDDWHVEYKYGLFNPKLGCAVSLEEGENRVLPPRAFGAAQWTVVSDHGYNRKGSELFRGAGVAIPVFSLRSAEGLGVGEFADLKPLADWAAGVGMKLIQILPINDTTSSNDWTDSYPYSAISVFALHPLYLRVDALSCKMPAGLAGELEAVRMRLNNLPQVDYEAVMAAKSSMLRRIFASHGKAIVKKAAFRKFLAENRHWVLSYAAFCVLRDRYGTADFTRWGEWAVYDPQRVEQLVEDDHPDSREMLYHIWLQFELDLQLADAVAHLHARGISLKGDLPIGIDRQSVDAWSAPHLFKMDAQAGAPPDAFAVKGQNWGFPTYHWEVMREDGYAWWRSRFAQLSRYFDAYRIDHILGFFRIWQIPADQVEGIMGWFDPATPVHVDEFSARGIAFDYNRFCRPYIRGHSLPGRFGEHVDRVLAEYLDDCGFGYYQLRAHVSTQRKIADHFAAWDVSDPQVAATAEWLRAALMDCASDVLFFEVPGSNGTLFHPRCSLHGTRSYQELDPDTQWRINDLYVDYFFRRQEGFWQARGYEKLPAMRQASTMLLCGEDLGMVPACVPGVLRELGILSLEIQRMPKSADVAFAHPASAPYMSVVSPSTHDMPTLRGWWKEDQSLTSTFAWQMLGIAFPPATLDGGTAASIIAQHLHSPAMWAIFPLQDLLAIDESLRHPDPDAERINVPAIMPYYWRYRMHLGIGQLADADSFNGHLREMIHHSGR